MIEFFASLFSFIQFASLLAVLILLILVALGEMGAFRFNHRELIPWLAFVLIILVAPPGLQRMFYDILLWVKPEIQGIETWLFARLLAIFTAAISGGFVGETIDHLSPAGIRKEECLSCGTIKGQWTLNL